MRRIEKNTNKTKGIFLQSLSSAGGVNTLQKSWQGGRATQISPGVIDYSALLLLFGMLSHLHSLGLAFFKKTSFALEKQFKLAAAVSAASASKAVA